MTKKVAMAQAKAELSQLASRAAAGERFVLLRRGRPLAALVGAQDLATLEAAGVQQSFADALAAFRSRHRGHLPEERLRVRRSAGRAVP
ncbi:MAG TPA: type II toxin-antitoxin system prevent-host-death family antitoxin [Polyangia bacterium]|jgi:prevent-host-death family protein